MVRSPKAQFKVKQPQVLIALVSFLVGFLLASFIFIFFEGKWTGCGLGDDFIIETPEQYQFESNFQPEEMFGYDCEDTDNGLDYQTQGEVIQLKDEGDTEVILKRVEDVCIEDFRLREYYCQESQIASKIFSCPTGCTEGRCSP